MQCSGVRHEIVALDVCINYYPRIRLGEGGRDGGMERYQQKAANATDALSANSQRERVGSTPQSAYISYSPQRTCTASLLSLHFVTRHKQPRRQAREWHSYPAYALRA